MRRLLYVESSGKKVADFGNCFYTACYNSTIMDANQPPVQIPFEGETLPSHLKIGVELPPGSSIHLVVETRTPDGKILEEKSWHFSNPEQAAETIHVPSNLPVSRMLNPAGKTVQRKRWLPSSLTGWLLAGAVCIYVLTRLIGLVDWPIYFFTDEAIQSVLAGDFLRDGFKSSGGELFPTYFVNGNQYNLGTSVYLQILPYLLFGKSEFFTRAVPMLMTLLAAISIGLALRKFFGDPYPWLGTMVLSVTPAWFLHSRTAFETGLAVSFYAAFLYFYLNYRRGNIQSLYWAAFMAALSFYSYSPAQMVIAVTAVFLFFSDLRYHLKNWKPLLTTALILGILAIPYIRFLIKHPGENYKHLVILNSYWIQSIPWTEKLAHFGTEYLKGINPLFWFQPESEGLVRHLMKNYGLLLRPLLPFFLSGLILSVLRIRRSEYRLLLISLLAAPAGAALVEWGVTRALFIVVPASFMTAIGISWVLQAIGQLIGGMDWKTAFDPLRKQVHHARIWLALPVFLLFAAGNSYMLWDALKNGPLWYDDYGLGGMQYGGRQLFAAVREYMEANPGEKVMVSPSWANGTDMVARYFADDLFPRLGLGSIEGHLYNKNQLDLHTVYVLIPEEYKKVTESGKFKTVDVIQTLPYPNGQPGFYFTHLEYVDHIDAILAKEREDRKVLQEASLLLKDGSPVNVKYSLLDIGEIKNLFDDDNNSLLRTMEANPFITEVQFAEPRLMQVVKVRVGGVPTSVRVVVRLAGSGEEREFIQQVAQTPDPREVVVEFPEALSIDWLRLEVKSVNDTEPAHVHIWEARFE